MTTTAAMICVHHVRPALKGITDLDERVRAAFKEAQSFWASTDEDIRYRGAVAAVVLETTDQKGRLERSIKIVSSLGALMVGVPVNLELLEGELKAFKPVPLVGMWKDAVKEARW